MPAPQHFFSSLNYTSGSDSPLHPATPCIPLIHTHTLRTTGEGPRSAQACSLQHSWPKAKTGTSKSVFAPTSTPTPAYAHRDRAPHNPSKPALFPPASLYWFPRAVTAKYHTLGSLSNRNSSSPGFWRPEVQGQGVSGGGLRGRLWSRPLPSLLVVCQQCLTFLSFLVDESPSS